MPKSIVPLQVRHIIVDLGCGIELDAYTADEQRKDGSFINYLSGRGIADAARNARSTAAVSSMSKELKDKLSNGSTVAEKEWKPIKAVYKMSSGGKTSLGLWTTFDAVVYFSHYAQKGNPTALDIVCALAAGSLDTIINDAFGRNYERGDTGRSVKDYLRATPKEWDLHFDRDWQAAAVQCLGIPWQGQAMAKFIVNYIYRELGIWEDLQELNTDPSKNRYFQYIEEVADNAVVKKHINIIYTLLRRSINRAEFKRAYSEFKSGHMQTSMF